jgi:hypothetical protein
VSVFCTRKKNPPIVAAAVARTSSPLLSAITTTTATAITITIAVICHATTVTATAIVVIGIAATAIIVQVCELPLMQLPT